MTRDDESYEPEAIAVVGMAGRFPGAANVGELWRNVVAGTTSISRFTAEELATAGVSAEVSSLPQYVPAKGVLEDAELFDAAFFGLTAREAEIMDPQNRIFLECCWSAVENAGYDLASSGERAGIYAGTSMSTYLLSNLLTRPDVFEKVGGFQVRITNEKDSLAGWAAYRLNLRGPCLALQCACSTSLVAVHFACQGLLDEECDLALAGGVSVSMPTKSGYLFQQGGILSADGYCRPFDASAQGTVPGNGAGVVVLRRLSDALEAGDTIRAVIRGTTVGNDGSLRAGYTAPGVEGQMRVMAEAMSLAEVEPETIGYVECHGSGTSLGDPIEIEALTRAFRRGTDRKAFCALGSVKTNIGHLDCAAGVAGLIKTVCALEAKQIPPNPNFETPNPAINFASSPFYVNREARPWEPAPDLPRRAGVSSFGIGGTNAHAVLEEAPPPPAEEPSRPWQQIFISARSESALEAATALLQTHLRSPAGESAPLADVAYTLKVGRRDHRYRLAMVCRDASDALAVLEARDPNRCLAGDGLRGDASGSRPPKIAFLFPGIGDQAPGMTLDLFRHEPTFRATVTECSRILEPFLGVDLRQVLYPAGTDAEVAAGAAGTGKADLRRLLRGTAGAASDEEQRLHRTRLAHPIVFTIEYALARLLGSWGIEPKTMIGYSLGEYVAACLAGVFSLPDALKLVSERARMIDRLPTGAMLAVPLPAEEIDARLGAAGLSLSAANGASLSVVGGPLAAVEALAASLEAEGVACQTLRGTHAFHTPMMEPIRQAFTRMVATLKPRAPKIPFISNLSGAPIRDEEATDPAYWGRHLCETVRFAEGLDQLLTDENLRLLEIGPGQALSTLVRQHSARGTAEALATLPHPDQGISEQAHLLQMTSRLWLSGVELDWRGFFADEKRRRIPLPSYPFERRRYWIDPGTGQAMAAAPPTASTPTASTPTALTPALETDTAADLIDAGYLVGWKRSELGREPRAKVATAPLTWLIFLDQQGVGVRLSELLRDLGHPVITVIAGKRFVASTVEQTPDKQQAPWVVAPERQQDYARLLHELESRNSFPQRIVHLLNLTGEEPADEEKTGFAGLLARVEATSSAGLDGLLFLARALGECHLPTPVEIAVVTDGLHEILGNEVLFPLKAALLGPCRVISQEYPRLTCRSIDLEGLGADEESHHRVDDLTTLLQSELLVAGDETVVAYRGRHRWVRTLEPTALEPVSTTNPVLRPAGVYLVVGENETARVMARHLAEATRARLAILLPAGASGEAMRSFESLKDVAEDLLLETAELEDAEQVASAVRRVHQHYGALHGVVHTVSPPGAGVIQLKTPEQTRSVLIPKITGSLALIAAVKEVVAAESLDFLALFSSTVSLTGGIGQVENCAANAVVDALARWPGASSLPLLTIGWDPFRWQEHHPSLPPELIAQIDENLATFGIDAETCGELFDRCLATGLPQLWVSLRPLVQIERQVMEKPADLLAALGIRPQEAHGRPDLATPYRPATSETEKRLARLWQDSIGTDRVGVDDNFFELDGNSLIALQLATRVRTELAVDLPVSALFEAPTISQMAERVEQLRREAEELAQTEALLAEIENLSHEEAELLLTGEKENI